MYKLIQNLHIALSLITTPFLLIFAISSFFIAHNFLDFSSYEKKIEQIKLNNALTDPSELAILFSKDHGIRGKLVDQSVDESGRIKLSIYRPGKLSKIAIDTNTSIATVVHETRDLFGFTIPLHESSGPKSDNFGEKCWDLAVLVFSVLLIFVLITGLLLWLYRSKDRTNALIFLGISVTYSVCVLCVIRLSA